MSLGLSLAYGQCPGPATCITPSFLPNYEQLNTNDLPGAEFCSGETRDFTLNVVRGTTNRAANNDPEYVNIFLDLDCDGTFEYEVSDMCRYRRGNPEGCAINLSITVPSVTEETTFRGRAMLAYLSPVSNACSNITWGDVEDFTITVSPALISSSDADLTLCEGEEVTFTGSGGDEFEFLVNGSTAQARSGSDTFTTTGLNDGDQVSVRAFKNSGCNSLSSVLSFNVVAPSIVSQPTDQQLFTGNNATFNVAVANADTYQWQVSMDNGNSYSNLSDSGPYSGTSTSTLTLTNPGLGLQGAMFRVLISQSAGSCGGELPSAPAHLQLQVATLITNRQLSYRARPE